MTIDHHDKKVLNWNGKSASYSNLNLINEEPLSIRLQGNPYSVVMRTPGEEIPHAAGFCVGEGIVESPSEIGSIGFCDNDTNVVTITLTPEKAKEIPEILERKTYVSQTSCGICGKELVEQIRQSITPVVSDAEYEMEKIYNAVENLSSHQVLRKKTRASHGAVLFNKDLSFLEVSEDAGRHNAVDKVIGKMFLADKLAEAKVLVLSSRISYELVQKAARAGIDIIAAVSRPTSLAVELAEELNITLCCLNRDGGMIVFSGFDKII